MCGRYALNHTPAMLQQWYNVDFFPAFPPRFNIAPTVPVAAVRATPQGHTASMMRWGLIPSWAKDPAALPLLFNARAETVMEKPMFRQAYKKRRCLIPASGFYEWKAVPGQKSKQPFYISFKDESPMSFAGLWERAAGDATLDTCVILTTEANRILEPIHHRMPVLLAREDWDAWLGATDDVEALHALLKPYDADTMRAWGVSHAVNRVAHDNAALIQPIAEGSNSA